MSTATEITRLTTARDTIRDKLIDLGLATSTSKLDALATAVDGIANRGAVSATVQEGDTYTIPAGYHNGSGTVAGVAGGGNYSLQSKVVTPTKAQQSITPDSGYYGMDSVTVNAIPEAYQNVSSVTATAGDVLSGKIFTTISGNVAGTMANNGAVSKKLDATSNNQSYTVPAGYHNGSGTVSITLESKSATPTTSAQTITPTSGKVLSSVTVNSIPSNYKDITDVTATASDVAAGQFIMTSEGLVEGTIPVIGDVVDDVTLDATTGNQSYTIPYGIHTGDQKVNITLETKTATPSTSAQNITPASGKVLSKVTVNAIPAKYGDTTGDDAVAANVLSGKKAHTIVEGTATQITGTMANNGAVSKTLDATTNNQSYTVPTGYHNGSGTVSITLESKSATPTESTQTITPTSGKVLSSVTVNPIPSRYKDTLGADAVPNNVLSGKVFVNSNGKYTGAMADNGTVSVALDTREGHSSYTIPEGYHNGNGTVSIPISENEYTVTPTEEEQTISTTVDGAMVGTVEVLGTIVVEPIPSEYKDTTNADAVAADVLSGKVFVNGTGEVTGTMANNGAVSKTLDATSNNQTYTVPAGYHNGSGTVGIVLETKTATPSTSTQNITPTSGKVLSKVTVNAIPAKYGDTTGDTAVAANLLSGVKAHTISNGTATQITGTMANHGSLSATIDGLTTTSYTLSAGYYSGGTVSLTNDIETALAAI